MSLVVVDGFEMTGIVWGRGRAYTCKLFHFVSLQQTFTK